MNEGRSPSEMSELAWHKWSSNHLEIFASWDEFDMAPYDQYPNFCSFPSYILPFFLICHTKIICLLSLSVSAVNNHESELTQIKFVRVCACFYIWKYLIFAVEKKVQILLNYFRLAQCQMKHSHVSIEGCRFKDN